MPVTKAMNRKTASDEVHDTVSHPLPAAGQSSTQVQMAASQQAKGAVRRALDDSSITVAARLLHCTSSLDGLIEIDGASDEEEGKEKAIGCSRQPDTDVPPAPFRAPEAVPSLATPDPEGLSPPDGSSDGSAHGGRSPGRALGAENSLMNSNPGGQDVTTVGGSTAAEKKGKDGFVKRVKDWTVNLITKVGPSPICGSLVYVGN